MYDITSHLKREEHRLIGAMLEYAALQRSDNTMMDEYPQ